MYLGDVTEYTEEDREKLLKKLLEIFLVEDELVYEIGWDIPTLLLPYFETSFDFYSGPLNSAPLISTLMSLFSTLANKGNSKELFLKSIECLGQLEIEPLGTDDTRSAEVPARFFELKFVAIFELLFSSLKSVKTQFPSRFLADGAAALVTFLVEQTENISLRTLIFILRRLFLFGRDYEPANIESISEAELDLQRKLLRRFVSDIAASGLHRFSLKLAQRFFVELKKGCAFGVKHSNLQKVYKFDEITEHFNDIFYRLMQLAYSLDINLDEEFQNIFKGNDEHKNDESNLVELSRSGIFLLATLSRFENRVNLETPNISFPNLIKITQMFLLIDNASDEIGISAGIIDSLSFWALWVTRALTAEEVQEAVDATTFKSYLNSLIYTAAISSAELRQINYMVMKRLLSLSSFQMRLDYLIDLIKHSPYLEIRDISIRMLKDFIVPPRASTENQSPNALSTSTSTTDSTDSHIDKVTKNISNLSIKPANKVELLTTLQQERLEKLILSQVLSVESIGDDDFIVLLSWINFLVVVETGISQRVMDHSKKLLILYGNDGSDEGLLDRATLLEIALSSLTKKTS